ncbi:MAG: hypothetical protein L6Q84_05055 [Polyangiaceae bacterium]|nr:hypothetical protein [Polyangiaceae bacterium]
MTTARQLHCDYSECLWSRELTVGGLSTVLIWTPVPLFVEHVIGPKWREIIPP